MADGQAGLWDHAPDLGFDLVKPGDPLQPVFGDRGGAVAGDFKEFAAGMRPAIGKPDGGASPVGLDQAVLPGMTIDLQDAGEALKMVSAYWPLRLGA